MAALRVVQTRVLLLLQWPIVARGLGRVGGAHRSVHRPLGGAHRSVPRSRGVTPRAAAAAATMEPSPWRIHQISPASATTWVYTPLSHHQRGDSLDSTTRPTARVTWQDTACRPTASGLASTDTTYPSTRRSIWTDWWHHWVLPAGYPHSVAPSYARYTVYSLAGAVAGSASMVLSTQTLLVAVVGNTEWGIDMVVGDSRDIPCATPDTTDTSTESDTSHATTTTAIPTTTTPTATPTASGALNWVLKDGLGQLGGILVASRLLSHNSTGRTSRNTETTTTHTTHATLPLHTLDAHPKLWRVVAALTLDIAAGLELLTPIVMGSTMVLGSTGGTTTTTSTVVLVLWASLANVIKNVGFVAASASRASLHQTLARSSNLADVTSKSASQGMVAGLIGTMVGVATSSSIGSMSLSHSHSLSTAFLVAYGILTVVHQVCVYQAVRAVALTSLNRSRVSMVLHQFVTHRVVLHPHDVAAMESLWPDDTWPTRCFVRSTPHGGGTAPWLSIGRSVERVFPHGPEQLMQCRRACDETARHVVHLEAQGVERVHLIFLDTANDSDMLLGLLHAFVLHDMVNRPIMESIPPEPIMVPPPLDHGDETATLIQASYRQAVRDLPRLKEQLILAGWDLSHIRVEDANAVRLSIRLE